MNRIAHRITINGAEHQIRVVGFREYSLMHVPDSRVPAFVVGTTYDGRTRRAFFRYVRAIRDSGRCICTNPKWKQ